MDNIAVTRSSMPSFEEYTDLIHGLWDSRWLTNAGVLHEELTARLKIYLDVENFLLFSNGHMALELGIQALGLSGQVITTPFTFISTTQAIVRNGLTPVFCDIDPNRLTIDTRKIESLITDKTSAIVAVHVYGIPCDTTGIELIAKKHGLKVIYDAAHCFNVDWQNRSIAKFGDLSIFSFHATKVFHTIEGGGAAFNDAHISDKLKQMRDFGLFPGGLAAYEIGVNAKLSEFHSAMGICNLRHINEEIDKRKAISNIYDERLKRTQGIQLFPELDGLKRNYAYYPVVIKDEFDKSRDDIVAKLHKHAISARKYFYPLTSAFSCYKDMPTINTTPIAEDISRRILCLPLYSDMTCENVCAVCDVLLDK